MISVLSTLKHSSYALSHHGKNAYIQLPMYALREIYVFGPNTQPTWHN